MRPGTPGRPGPGGTGRGGNRRHGKGKGSGRPLPDRLEALPYVTPRMLENFRRIGINTPADLQGRSGDDLYASLQLSYGEQPHHSTLYVLRAVAHFIRTGERRDWREFADVGHKRPRQQPPHRRHY